MKLREGGGMILRGSVYSQVLEMDTGLTVVAPARVGVEAGSEDAAVQPPYRSCYLLHGLCGNSGNFLDYTLLSLYAKEHPAYYIMPEVSRSFYADMRRGQRFFTYVTEELPDLCRRLFNISHRAEDTAVMGCSMGGYGALKCALRRPDQYGFAAAFSPAALFLGEALPALRTAEGGEKMREEFGEQIYTDLRAVFGDSLEMTPDDDVCALAAKVAGFPQKPRLCLFVGENDFLLEENRRFRNFMADVNLDFTYAEAPGRHDWFFFDAALAKALAWWWDKEG